MAWNSTLETKRNVASLLRTVILIMVAAAAVSSRLFAVVRYESIIHEFDPWFNFRATKVLTKDGYYRFWNWFDPTAWYPLGRAAGGTVFPGLMVTSGTLYNILHFFNIPVNIRDVCVMLAPIFSVLTVLAAYLFTSVMKDDSAGLLAALFISIAPGYISRSVAGSYDNEAIAIFLLLFTFYLWVRAVRDGSMLFGTLTALFYFYMVAAWGGYVFITNMIPLHAFVLVLMGRFSERLYVAYSSFYAIGTLASMQIPFVGFQPVRTSEHMAALGVFGLLQLIALTELVRKYVTSQQFKVLVRTFVAVTALAAFAALVMLTYAGYIAPWTGRFYSLWDTAYAKKHIPIIASVSEHQPPAWPTYFLDLHCLVYLFPAGLFFLFHHLRDEHIFVVIYAVMASYFSGVMVRLILTLTPCVCVCGTRHECADRRVRGKPRRLRSLSQKRAHRPHHASRSSYARPRMRRHRPRNVHLAQHTHYVIGILVAVRRPRVADARRQPGDHRRFPRGLLLATRKHAPGCQGHELVGLWLSDCRLRRPHDTRRQQHMEQHPHCYRRQGHGIVRGACLPDPEEARCRLRPDHLRRSPRLQR